MQGKGKMQGKGECETACHDTLSHIFSCSSSCTWLICKDIFDRCFIGLEIDRDREAGMLSVTQPQRTQQVIQRSGQDSFWNSRCVAAEAAHC